MAEHVVEVRVPGRPTRRITVSATLDVGRECDGVEVEDSEVSRRHLRLSPEAGALTVTDLGSTNGTEVNGVPISGPTYLRAGDTVTLGSVEIVVVAASAPAPPSEPPTQHRDVALTPPAVSGVAPPPASAAPPPAPPTPATPPTGDEASVPVAPAAVGTDPVGRAPDPRPVLDELEARETDTAVIRYRPGTAGEQAAPGIIHAVNRARRRLAGFGSEPWGVRPQVCLVDPFPDPEHPGQVVTDGAIVDASRGEIWLVTTPESAPEPLERPLALLFGNSLPAGADLEPLLEGYGLWLAEPPDADPQLRTLQLPALNVADGELGSAMRLSFVRYLIDRTSRKDFVRMLASAQAGRLDAAAQEIYGLGMSSLEDAWRQKLESGPPDVKTGRFLRLTLRYLRPHVRREAEMFIYMLLGLVFTTVFPFAFRRLLDTAIPSGEFSQALRILGVLGIAFVVSLVAGLRRAYLAAQVSGSVVRQLRVEMFSKMQALSSGWFSRHQQGDVLSRMFSDVGALEQGLSQTLREGFFQVLSLVVSAIVLLTLDLRLGLIVLAAAPLIGLTYKAMAKGAQRRSLAVQEQTGSVLTNAAQNYDAQPVVKAFALEAREIGRFRRSSDQLYNSEVRLQLFGGLFALSVNMIVTALRMFILGYGAWLILHGDLTVGGLVAFIGLMGEVLGPVTVLTGIGQQIQAATGALVRINDVLESEPEVGEDKGASALPPLSGEIRLSGVGFSYTPERRTLGGIDAVIEAGQRVAFVGPTGAGKSSVLQLLMRFYDPDEGQVLFDGVDTRQVTLSSLRGQLGVVFQETFLFDASIGENIAMGSPGATEAQVQDAARAAELHDFVTTLPRGYETLVGERGGRLSGGQRQRVAIARALLRDPRVLLLDEATSALDPRTERLIADTLERVGQGRTTIAVTHRLTSITGYDRIFVIVEGNLVEQGTHDELLAAGGVYATLWAEQTGGRVPSEVPFDAVSALMRIPIFTTLSPSDLEIVAQRLRSLDLAPGETLSEGGGRVMIVRRGRARVLTPDFSGAMVASSELGSGDAFGVAALLGHETGARLQAAEPLSVLVLDDEAIAGLAATYPTVGDALVGTREPTVAPAGGQRLSRMTIGIANRAFVAGAVSNTVPAPDVRRLTGTLPAMGPR